MHVLSDKSTQRDDDHGDHRENRYYGMHMEDACMQYDDQGANHSRYHMDL
jgi:hypothetical protein